MEYTTLVLRLLEKAKYPVLDGYVLLDIYYKTIPPDQQGASSRRYDRRMISPEDVYIRDAKPFRLHYLSSVDTHHFCVHYVDALDAGPLPMRCITLKLDRSFLDRTVLHAPSVSFEHEIYHFLTLLNFDVPRIADLLDTTFVDSTRFLPQRIRLWAFRYSERPVVRHPEASRSCFGPPDYGEVIPVRVLEGRLSACTSNATLLSLNNHFDFPAEPPYVHHYSEKWKAIVPLAFNPLENPVVTPYHLPGGSPDRTSMS